MSEEKFPYETDQQIDAEELTVVFYMNERISLIPFSDTIFFVKINFAFSLLL